MGKHIKSGMVAHTAQSSAWWRICASAASTRFPNPSPIPPRCSAPCRIPADLAVRTSVPPLSLANTVRRSIAEIERKQAVSAIRTMEDILDFRSQSRAAEQMFVLNTFALLALLLAVAERIWRFVARRHATHVREIAVRMALGAAPVMSSACSAAWDCSSPRWESLSGCLPLSGLTRIMKALLFGVIRCQPTHFQPWPLPLSSVSGCTASLLPARARLSA